MDRQVATRRRARYAPYATALVEGARVAYRNREAITKAVRAVKDVAKRRRTSESAVVEDYAAPGNDLSRSVRRVGWKPRPTVDRLNKMVEASFNKVIYRAQGITNYDTNQGYFPLENALFGGTVPLMPIHIYDLTGVPNTSAPIVANRYSWTATASTADVASAPLPFQTASGVGTTTAWTAEQGHKTPTEFPNSRVMRHDWTDIRLNLYGPRKRTTRFEVLFFRVKDTLAHPFAATGSNTSFKELMQYLERPLIFSNLQSSLPNVAKKMNIVKRFTYYVPGGQTTDVDTTTGKIKEARIFMRHGNVYNLDWRADSVDQLPHVQADGSDFVSDTSHQNHPWHGSRLLMAVMAFSPERRAVTAYDVGGAGSDALTSPSYDILIRNAVSFP